MASFLMEISWPGLIVIIITAAPFYCPLTCVALAPLSYVSGEPLELNARIIKKRLLSSPPLGYSHELGDPMTINQPPTRPSNANYADFYRRPASVFSLLI
jgi:hypothetical protein